MGRTIHEIRNLILKTLRDRPMTTWEIHLATGISFVSTQTQLNWLLGMNKVWQNDIDANGRLRRFWDLVEKE